MIINAENSIVGRVCTVAAKQALLGEDVHIINCEKAVMSGNPQTIKMHLKRFQAMGTPRKGPFIPRQPQMFFKRKVRGMLPYKIPRGRAALERIKCHVGATEAQLAKAEVIKAASADKLPNLKFITVKEACRFMGGKE